LGIDASIFIICVLVLKGASARQSSCESAAIDIVEGAAHGQSKGKALGSARADAWQLLQLLDQFKTISGVVHIGLIMRKSSISGNPLDGISKIWSSDKDKSFSFFAHAE
jgi:hypothetical protein